VFVLAVAGALVAIGVWSGSAAAQLPPTPEPVVAPRGGSGQLVVVEVPPHTIPVTNSGVAPIGLLPRTGGSVVPWLIQLAVGLIVAGALMVLASRSARDRPPTVGE
jgi:hypothetical protein